MRASFFVAALTLVGCGGRLADDATTGDAAVDSVISVDTGLLPKRDSGPKPPPDLGPEPEGCAQRLSPGFICSEPEPAPGRRVCNDVAIRAIVDGCFGGAATSESCESARKSYSTCSTCMLNDWLIDGMRLAVAECMQKIDPKNSCVKTVACTYDCLDEVCLDCDYTPGTGSGGGSELDDCWENEFEGQCAAHSRDYLACIGDPKLSVCYPSTVDDLMPFYRGACRDGGNWSRAFEPDPVAVDAGGSGG